jgi:hypothetical protein
VYVFPLYLQTIEEVIYHATPRRFKGGSLEEDKVDGGWFMALQYV